jgi:hypothetical protein
MKGICSCSSSSSRCLIMRELYLEKDIARLDYISYEEVKKKISEIYVNKIGILQGST